MAGRASWKGSRPSLQIWHAAPKDPRPRLRIHRNNVPVFQIHPQIHTSSLDSHWILVEIHREFQVLASSSYLALTLTFTLTSPSRLLSPSHHPHILTLVVQHSEVIGCSLSCSQMVFSCPGLFVGQSLRLQLHVVFDRALASSPAISAMCTKVSVAQTLVLRKCTHKDVSKC